MFSIFQKRMASTSTLSTSKIAATTISIVSTGWLVKENARVTSFFNKAGNNVDTLWDYL